MGRIQVCGIGFDSLGATDLAACVSTALAAGTGGWVTVPCLDALVRAMDDPGVRAGLGAADHVLATGTILRVASLIAGTPLSASQGSHLIWSVLEALPETRRGVYLLGGQPEEIGQREGAHRAASVLSFACPGILIAGHASPRLGGPTEDDELLAIRDEIVEASPDVVVVGLDVAKQAWFAMSLRRQLPNTWFIGWLPAIDMLVGHSGGADQPAGLGARGRRCLTLLGPARRLWGRALRERLAGDASDPARVDPAVLRQEAQHRSRSLSDG